MLDLIKPKLNGKKLFQRILIKRIGYETYLGNGLWALDFDNATEEEFEEYMSRYCVNSDDDEYWLGKYIK